MTPIELHTAHGEFSQQMGRKVDDLLQAAKDEGCRLEGACAALAESAGKIDAHKGYWSKSVEEKEASKAENDVAQRVIGQCAGIVRNILESGRQRQLIQVGQVQFGELVLNLLESTHQKALQTAQAMQQDAPPASSAARRAQSKPRRVSAVPAQKSA